jgi:hypothetical protein
MAQGVNPHVLTTITTRHKVWSVDTKESIGYQMRDVSLISANYNGKPDFGVRLGNCREMALTPGRYVRITIEVLRTDEEVRNAIDQQEAAPLHGSDSP